MADLVVAVLVVIVLVVGSVVKFSEYGHLFTCFPSSKPWDPLSVCTLEQPQVPAVHWCRPAARTATVQPICWGRKAAEAKNPPAAPPTTPLLLTSHRALLK